MYNMCSILQSYDFLSFFLLSLIGVKLLRKMWTSVIIINMLVIIWCHMLTMIGCMDLYKICESSNNCFSGTKSCWNLVDCISGVIGTFDDLGPHFWTVHIFFVGKIVCSHVSMNRVGCITFFLLVRIFTHTHDHAYTVPLVVEKHNN